TSARRWRCGAPFRIGDVTAKQGRSGTLCFVTVHHEYWTTDGLAISERHDIVYREDATTPTQAKTTELQAPRSENSRETQADSVPLSRYSAIALHVHRIHVGLDYAENVDNYPGLVVHRPLQVIMLLRYGLELMPVKGPFSIAYRGARPPTAGLFTLNATREG